MSPYFRMLGDGDVAALDPCPTTIKTHAFTAMGVFFHVLKMNNSFVLWIGHEEPKVNSLSTAISLPSRPPAASKLMGNADWTIAFAQKLSLRTKHQVFVLADELEPDEIPLSEKVVFQKLSSNPEIFLTGSEEEKKEEVA